MDAFQTDQTRRYPIGDAAIIEKGILTGWSDVFEHEGDRFLASFAVPGVKAAQIVRPCDVSGETQYRAIKIGFGIGSILHL